MTTLVDALSRMNVDQLKPLVAWLGEVSPKGRKDELIGGIMRSLSASGLRLLWAGLDELQRLAVAEALHAADGVFHSDQFRAKHGRLPAFTTEARPGTRSGSPTRLALFLFPCERGYCVPIDLRPALRAFVPEPEPARVATLEALPSSFGDAALTFRPTERDALVDLPLMLRLAEQGRIQVGDKTSLPTAPTLRLLTEKLAGGDFYADESPKNRWDQRIGPIKAFAWPMLLQAAGLVQRKGAKLALSKAGLKAVGSAPAGVLRSIWQKWLGSDLLDEFSRIDTIKGQRAKGRVMSAAAPRRDAICEALDSCPVGAWIGVDEFSRFMLASDHAFDVAHDPWKLYVGEAQYGSLGYAGFHDWAILQFRYLLCFLFEYAAPLGVIDVAYIAPGNARSDFHHLWGIDDLQFLSRYDGLAFFRITPLGEYCLGSSADYASAPLQNKVRLAVLPSLQVRVVDGEASAEEALTLEAWGVQETPHSWRLDRHKAIAAMQRGHSLDDLHAFLQARDEQPLPETIQSFIATCRKNGKALKVAGTTLLIECQDEQIASLVAGHKLNAGLCLRAGERHLVVRLEHEKKFRALVRTLGLGMPA
jgi:hypothetical protein